MDVAAVETTEPVVVFAAPDARRERAGQLLGEEATLLTAGTVAGAIEELESAERVDCVVTADELAHGTGVELAGAVRELDAELPVLYVAATPTVADAEAATAAGATVYLPLDRAEGGELREQLAAVVAEYDRHRNRRRKRDLFEALLEHAPLSLFVKDREGRHVCASRSVESGVDGSILGRTDLELYGDSQEGIRATYEDDLDVVATGEPILQQEERQVTDDGTVFWYRTTKLPLWTDDGEVQGLLGVTRDITETKRREAELERQRWRLEQFAEFTSTELRAPIERAIAAVERARQPAEDAAPAAGEQASGDGASEAGHRFDDEALSEADAALARTQDLVDTVLSIARPQSATPEREWLPLAEIARQAWMGMGDTDSTLAIDVPEHVEVHADESQFRQFLEHVFRSAVELDRREGVDDASGDSITLACTDTGLEVVVADVGEPEDDPGAYRGSQLRVAIADDIATAHGWVLRREDDTVEPGRFVLEHCVLRHAGADSAESGPPVPLAESGDVGGATPPGEATATNGGWRLRGGGDDLWRDSTEFHGAWTLVGGDVRIEARLVDFAPDNDYSKAGVGLFDPEDADAPLVVVGRRGTETTELLGRAVHGAPIESQVPEIAEELEGRAPWFRIDRVGEWMTCLVSADGEEWTPVGHYRLHADRIASGLVVCSRSGERTAEASFHDVALRRLDPPTTPREGTDGEVTE